MIEPSFDHTAVEKKLLQFWEEGDWFHAKVDPSKTPFTVLIPPPNVTARLHMGHGLNNTLQDILVRRKRMMGFNALWLPGTDHAGIATQMMVERSLEHEGTSRKEMGRDRFLGRCVEWKDENGGIIIEQLKRLGSSCDWKRQAYTMDPKLSSAVRAIFVKLFEDGLIYRGERLVNWDPVLQTAISDDEVESKEVDGNLYSLAYPVEGMAGREVVVATSRPETMLGDTAVAVHPEDERYQDLVGKQVRLPFSGRLIPILADEFVKPEFGTGCVKITPAHDPNDFAMAKRHGLPMLNIMNEDGTMTQDCPEAFRGLGRLEVRKKILIELKALGLFRGIKPYRHAVPHSERSKSPIEPRLSKQWYVKMKPLAGPAIEAVKEGKIKLYPDHLAKTYLHWLENIEDWCISRQLWWGHRIPIWYCAECLEVTTGLEDPSHCRGCGSSKLSQDEDVLDTWFSSWLWPLSPFGWPDTITPELDYFFPTQALVTGAEIIFLWVARMVMVSYYVRGEAPFRDVYFNSIICDKQGRKFSKTLGNGIDPLEVIDQRGADAVRFTCVSLAPLGGRVRMEVSDFENGSRFITKIWNAARFLLRYTDGKTQVPDFVEERLSMPMKWLLVDFNRVSKRVNDALESYQINEAVESLYHFVWGSFCDWGVEAAKLSLESPDETEKQNTLSLMFFVFEGALRLLHPVVPFVTEEIWHHLPKHPRQDRPKSLVIAGYPQGFGLSEASVQSAEEWQSVALVISSIRSLRTQASIPPKEKLEATLHCEPGFAGLIEKAMPWLLKLSGLKSLALGKDKPRPDQSLVATGQGYTVYLPVGDYLDVPKETERLKAEASRIEKIIKGLEVKLSSESFVAKAPKEVVESSRAQMENMQTQLKAIQETLAAFGTS